MHTTIREYDHLGSALQALKQRAKVSALVGRNVRAETSVGRNICNLVCGTCTYLFNAHVMTRLYPPFVRGSIYYNDKLTQLTWGHALQ